MRRTDLIDPAEHQLLAQPVRTRWAPRARRLSVSIEVQFRRKSSDAWSDGTITNISQSGVLIAAASEVHLPRHAAVEMTFEMPKEISGQPHSRVLCDAYIVRAGSAGHASSSIAAAILEYKFLHAQETAAPAPPITEPTSASPAEVPATGPDLTHRRRYRLRTRESRSTR